MLTGWVANRPGHASADRLNGWPPGAGFPEYTPAERLADTVVHVIGLALGVVGCTTLFVAAQPRADLSLLISLGLYAIGLMSMLGCSALYNLTGDGLRKSRLLRLDHAAIFMMIAGTYTPFTLVAIGGVWGLGLLAFVWAVAIAGMACELLALRRANGLQTAAYLVLGWSILVVLEPLSAAVSLPGLVLLVAGGMLYSVGVVFHRWTRLPYQNAIWHGFVLAAAVCHYLAVLGEFARS